MPTLPDNDTMMKIGAVAAAAVLLLAPYLPKIQAFLADLFASLKKVPLPTVPDSKADELSDMKTVLEMANRLRKAGKTKAVELCQELLDEMLAGE